MGFCSTNVLDKESLKEAAETAIKLATVQKKRKKIELAEIKTVDTTWDVKTKREFPGVEDKIDFLSCIKNCLMEAANVQAHIFQLDDHVVEKFYMSSEGAKILSRVPRLSFLYFITIGEGSKNYQMMRQYGNTGGWEFSGLWNVEDNITHDAKVLNNLLKRGKKPPRGTIDAVLGPQLSGIIAHESCGHPFETDRILGREAAQAGKSFITKEMVGERIGSDDVTVVDDPTIPNSYGYYCYDDEGVRAKKRYLIKQGKINSFLHNRETAFLMKTSSNASARASNFDAEPIIRMANTYIEPGEYSLEELVEDIKLGIYMPSFMEWNIDDKRYSQKYVGSEAYLIKNGELTYPVQNPTLEITTPRLYQSIDSVGNHEEFHAAICGKGDPMQGIPVWTGGGAIRLRQVKME
jgi:TldD protein